MNINYRAIGFAAATLLGFLQLSTSASADVIIDILQVGSDVVATGSGSFDTTDLTVYSVGYNNIAVTGNVGYALLGPGPSGLGGPIESLIGLSGPYSFGSGNYVNASSGSGDLFGVQGAFPALYAPAGYVSGTSLSATDTWSDSTISGIGLTDGTYVYTWGSGNHAGTLTVNVGAVPEPSTWAMMILGFAAVGMVYRRRISLPAVA
jgi:PEP-CTERM motif